MGKTMKQSTLFSLHPMAWSHAQIILRQEMEMLKQGIGKRKRAAFLNEECSRLIRQSEITLMEAFQDLLNEFSREDVVVSIDEMRKRFEFHGFNGTLRSIRNNYRAIGFPDPGLDGVMIASAVATLENDEEFMLLVRNTFEPLMNAVIESSEFEALGYEIEKLNDAPLLPSVREQRAYELLWGAFNKINPRHINLPQVSVRDVVYLRGRLLNVEIADLFIIIVSHAGLSALSDILIQSRETQLATYRSVISTLINERLSQFDGQNGFAERSDVGTDRDNAIKDTAKHTTTIASAQSTAITTQFGLLTIQETMIRLKISRATLSRLRKEGAIESVLVRKSIRITEKSIKNYLGNSQ